MNIPIYVVSAFCKNATGGNKAGVILTDMYLTRQQKINIAGTLGYSETVFVFSSEVADFRLEYFTPSEEVPLCGHATIAAFFMLRKLNLLKQKNHTIETKSGVLSITIAENGVIFMEQNLPQYFDILDKYVMQPCFHNLKTHNNLPIQMVSTGLKDIFLPIDCAATLLNMTPDFTEITNLSKKMDCIGIHAFSLENSDSTTAICRNFAPLYGINEEAATGTSSCALACYLHQNGLKKDAYIFEQGHVLNSVSKIYVKLTTSNDQIVEVFVGGNGRFVKQLAMEIL